MAVIPQLSLKFIASFPSFADEFYCKSFFRTLRSRYFLMGGAVAAYQIEVAYDVDG